MLFCQVREGVCDRRGLHESCEESGGEQEAGNKTGLQAYLRKRMKKHSIFSF